MHPFYRELLNYIHGSLLTELKLTDDNLEVCMREGVLTKDEVQRIRSHELSSQRNDAFLCYLKRCPPELDPYLLLVRLYPFIKRAVGDAVKDPALRYRLRQVLRGKTCYRCTMLRYVSCESLLKELCVHGLVKKGVVIRSREWMHLSEADQLDNLFNELCEDEKSYRMLEIVKGCIIRVLSPRSPKLARYFGTMDPDDMQRCNSTHREGIKDLWLNPYTGSASAERPDAFRPPQPSFGGTRTRLLKLLVRYWLLSSNNRQHLLNRYIKHLQHLNSNSRPDISAMLTLLPYFSPRCHAKQAMEQLPLFESIVHGAIESTLLRYYAGIVKGKVFNRMARSEDGIAVLYGTLQEALALNQNPALAPLHETYAMVFLHKTVRNVTPQSTAKKGKDFVMPNDTKTPYGVGLPSTEAMEAALRCLRVAYEIFQQIKVASGSSCELRYGFEVFGVGTLLRYIFTRLGVCVAGAFVHPAGMPECHRIEVEELLRIATSKFPDLPWAEQATMRLAESDYHMRMAENAFSARHPGVKEHIAVARAKAMDAQTLSRLAGLPDDGVYTFAQRRIDLLRGLETHWFGMPSTAGVIAATVVGERVSRTQQKLPCENSCVIEVDDNDDTLQGTRDKPLLARPLTRVSGNECLTDTCVRQHVCGSRQAYQSKASPRHLEHLADKRLALPVKCTETELNLSRSVQRCPETQHMNQYQEADDSSVTGLNLRSDSSLSSIPSLSTPNRSLLYPTSMGQSGEYPDNYCAL